MHTSTSVSCKRPCECKCNIPSNGRAVCASEGCKGRASAPRCSGERCRQARSGARMSAGAPGRAAAAGPPQGRPARGAQRPRRAAGALPVRRRMQRPAGPGRSWQAHLASAAGRAAGSSRGCIGDRAPAIDARCGVIGCEGVSSWPSVHSVWLKLTCVRQELRKLVAHSATYTHYSRCCIQCAKAAPAAARSCSGRAAAGCCKACPGRCPQLRCPQPQRCVAAAGAQQLQPLPALALAGEPACSTQKG